ncbi:MULTISPECIES: AraC family transcriptional regulator [unclassified Gordonia (in: high G+C Gram-positive bacteria)]|uniref:AraC family transcriptional regulator n=1 Tax=unclassified Gordonia (in: high G+C Gram-positive bacteria) TaxID=2657482 RepID=UPI0025C20C1C|nr:MULTISPECIES: AraC family transcriptional regulator [unclassified Gordonia (in: high G+C Gram-positive bacteria)]HNP56592.1 AraC family transcriptional regulator [Gordonia sp. (in: high G+C Gram-positive bacteria)]
MRTIMGNGEGAQRVCLRTADLGSMEGRREWADTIGALYGDMGVDWPNRLDRLEAEWSGHAFGDLHISSIQCQQHTVVRSPEMVRGDPTAGFLVCMVTSGTVEIEQRDRTNVLSPGAFTLLHLGTPFVFRTPSAFSQVAVRIPATPIVSRLPERVLEGSLGCAFNSAGPSAVVGRLIADLAGLDDDVPEQVRESFAAATMDMLAASVLEAVVDTGAAQVYRTREVAAVKRVVADHLHEPDLTLPHIAADVGMSLRSMQKLLGARGLTPSALLNGARMDRAKLLLNTTELSVAEVAAAVGHQDVSHFSRTFRKTVGMSPGRFREAGKA